MQAAERFLCALLNSSSAAAPLAFVTVTTDAGEQTIAVTLPTLEQAADFLERGAAASDPR